MNIELWPDTIKVTDETGEHHVAKNGGAYEVIVALVNEVMVYRKEKSKVSRVMRGGLAVIERLNAVMHITGNKGIQTHESGQTVDRFEKIEQSMGIERIEVERSFNYTETRYLDQVCPECKNVPDSRDRCFGCHDHFCRTVRVAEDNPIKVVVNGKEHGIMKTWLSYHEVAELAGLKGEGPTVTYRGDRDGEHGNLSPESGTVGIANGTIFNVVDTGAA